MSQLDNVGQQDTGVSVAVITEWSDIEALHEDWTEILERNASLTIFLTSEWLGAWWQAFQKGKQLHALVFRDSHGVVVGLVPLYIQQIRSTVLPRLNELRFVGDGTTDSDNLDLIVMPGYEEPVARKLVEHLNSSREWDVCRFNVMPSDSVTSKALRQSLTSASLKSESSAVASSSIELPDSFEEYLQGLSAKERKKIGNLRRRLESRYKVKLSRCTSLEELPSYVETLFRLHQKRWQALHKPGAFASPERRLFYYQIAQKFLTRGWLVFWSLELDGIPVASQFGFQYRGTFYSLQEGFDPEYSADSVGFLLRSYSIRKLIEAGVRRYDFLAGQESSKLRWNCLNGNYVNFTVARRGTRGSIYLSLERAKRACKSSVRQLLPEPCVTFLNRLRTQSAG